jgi:hypothetical protein
MSDDVFTSEERHLRGTDSNSLLRMYDRAHEIFNRSALQEERGRADKAIQRIAKELKKRNVGL